MFGRPRCREWTPLATQQLRLRNLIQIVGYNIRPPEWCCVQCSFYYTLHHTTMSAPFYTSERISSPHPKWKEIDSDITQRMTSMNVIIRIWCHLIQPEKPSDRVIETWGVYFTGLRLIGSNLALDFTSDSFKMNTLVFQMHGGYFCSYKSLKLEVVPPENFQESPSSDSSSRLSHKVNNRLIQSRSMSPSKHSRRSDEYSSNSPVDKYLKQNYTKSGLNRRRDESDEKLNADTNYIFEHSPDNLDLYCVNLSKNASREELFDNKVDLSETAENYDLRNESYGHPKYRYLALKFLKSEIRPSYNAAKLQKLHLLQYSIKKRQEAVQDIKERIYKKSALTNTEDCMSESNKCRSRSQRNLFSTANETLREKSASEVDLSAKNGRIADDRPVSNGPRLTLRLNDLLSFKAKPSPLQRAEHVRLTKQLEILRFKKIILSDERDSKLANIRRLKKIHSKFYEENQDLGTELMQNYHALSRRSDALKEMRQSAVALRELASRSHAMLNVRRSSLLNELHQIFFIDKVDAMHWSVCGIPLPVSGDENPRRMSNVSDSVAAGLAAQATCLAAALLSQPLRYQIKLLGSASKILDVTSNLPDPLIPLFARGGDLTLFCYAMFLLNKCIAQLLWGRGLPVLDIRPTLANLQRLMTTPSNLSETSKLFGTYKWLSETSCPHSQSLRSLVASDRGKHRQFNRFKDSVDGQSPQSAMCFRRHRHSRSVGSYNDDNEFDTSTTPIMGSEPSLYNTRLHTISDTTRSLKLLKTHNSDSEISRISKEEALDLNKVTFTLGDEEKLVKISCNGNDEVTCSSCNDESVARICTEISSFCSTEPSNDYFDVAKHIEAISVQKAEDSNPIVSCKSCENDLERSCNDVSCAKNLVEDVIVIQSAEAKLDTGQNISCDNEI